MRSMLLHILIILKILISEKTLEQEKLRNERGKRRNGHTRTSNGTPFLTGGKIEKLKVKELDFYLKEHGLTTIGRKVDKVKAIRCHYYQHIKESFVPKTKVTGSQGMENMRKNSTVRRTRVTMTLFSKIWMRRVTLLPPGPFSDNSVHIRWPNIWSCCSRFMKRKY